MQALLWCYFGSRVDGTLIPESGLNAEICDSRHRRGSVRAAKLLSTPASGSGSPRSSCPNRRAIRAGTPAFGSNSWRSGTAILPARERAETCKRCSSNQAPKALTGGVDSVGRTYESDRPKSDEDENDDTNSAFRSAPAGFATCHRPLHPCLTERLRTN